MLRKFCGGALFISRNTKNARLFCTSSNDSNGKNPKVKDVIDEDLLKAIDGVAQDIHPQNSTQKKSLKNTLINRLIENEKSTFDVASASASSELLDDQALVGFLSEVATDTKIEKKVAPRGAQLRQERRGLVLLRKEIFYQAVQSGYTTDEARIKSETIVNEAQEKLAEQRKSLLEGTQEMSAKEVADERERSEKEQKLFQMAFEFLEKIYKDDLINSDARKQVEVDRNARKLFGQEPLRIWEKNGTYVENCLGFWEKWDQRAAKITQKSFGPTNSFEEQIEWTESGKQWEYPIDNEFRLGDEQNVSFIDHVFLERHLPSLGIPKSGPIAHFMHLVCVGLSKNPYMSAAKKREHLEWFADYFNEEKQKLVHKLHEEEQLAAQNSA